MPTAAPRAAVFIDHIERNLPDENDPRSRSILLRVLLLLLRVRHLPGFGFVSVKVFAQLEKSVLRAWPRSSFELTNVVACFFALDDPTIAEIREHMQKLLDEITPTDSLKAYFARTFGAACADTDHTVKAPNDAVRAMMLIAVVQSSIETLEDFTVTLCDVDDKRIRNAICEFYGANGFRLVFGSGSDIVRAQKAGIDLWIQFSNRSASDGYILVTVKDR
jgi:hypothetical protein